MFYIMCRNAYYGLWLGLWVGLASRLLGAPVPVFNGDFERGLEGWSLEKPQGFVYGEARIETGDVHSGRRAVRIVNGVGERVLVGLSTVQPIALPADCRTFALTAWMKADVLPEMIELRVASTGADGKRLTPWQEHGWRFFRPPLEPHRGRWHQIRCEFGAHADWAGFQLTFWVRGAGANVIVDDIAVEALDPRVFRVPSVGQRLPDPAPGIAVWWERPEVKIYPEELSPPARGTGIFLAGCRGEYECLQLALRPEREIRQLRATCSALQGPQRLPAESVRFNFVGYVNVQAALEGRSVLGPTPDPLLPQAVGDLPAQRTSVFWLTVKIPPEALPGNYSGTIQLENEELRARIPLRLHVYAVTLPERPALRTIARIWKRHEGYEQEFLRNLQEHRCAGGYFPAGIRVNVKEEPAGGKRRIEVDTSGFPEAVEKYLRPYRFQIFNVPYIFLGDASGFYNKERKWFGFEIFSTAFDEAFRDYCRQVGAAIRAAGLMREAIWQIWDEPFSEEMENHCMRLAQLVKEACPDARVYLTSGIRERLLGLVDIWCLPWPSTYRRDLAEQVFARGGELFAYENSLYSLDTMDSLLLLRGFPWRLRKYNVTGVEWWAISNWTSDPRTTPNQYPPQNGGGFFLYPTADRKGAPIDSLRWELYREGVEDYDLLTLLRAEQEAAGEAIGCTDPRLSGEAQMQELVSRVALDASEIVRRADTIEKARQEACRRIEFLRATPPGVVGWQRDEKGRWRLIVVAARGAAVRLNGRTRQGSRAEIILRPGESVRVEIRQDGKSKQITLQAPSDADTERGKSP